MRSPLGFLLILPLMAAAPGFVAAQPPWTGAIPAAAPLPPLLYLRVDGPKGMKVTFHRTDGPQTFDAPCVVGLRPGYGCRLELWNVEYFPNDKFFPALEVRGSLFLGPRLRNRDYPAGLVFTREDFEAARADASVKKAVVLERADEAVPRQSRAETPFEFVVPPNRDIHEEAHARGQVLLLAYMGERKFRPEEMLLIPGTVLLPGDKVLPPPRLAPFLPWRLCPIVDPVAGIPHPGDLITLWDGGDVALPAGLKPGGMVGVDPTDTLAEYKDSQGRRKLAVSNRVGLCIPRFVVVRGSCLPAGHVARYGLARNTTVEGRDVFTIHRGTVRHDHWSWLEELAGRNRPAGTANAIGTAVRGRVDGVVVAAQVDRLADVAGACPPPSLAKAEGKLKIDKWPDKKGGLVGDVITFTLRYVNQGEKAITDIVVVDALGPRFDYVAGSARTDRPAVFTTQPNDAGSATLRWRIQGTLAPGETGTVVFQVRVR